LIPKADPSVRENPGVGVDAGATLAKLAIREPSGELGFRIVPSYAIERAAREVEAQTPDPVGLTGAGAPRLRDLLGLDTTPVPEFEAWRAGAGALLARQGAAPTERDLLVSLGTGTSVLLIEPEAARRVGGTALGGGTLLGLSAAALGISDFDEFLALASRGDRRNVDLLVGDIDPTGDLPLHAEITASSLAKLAWHGAEGRPEPEDLAHALIGLVGENVGMLCGMMAVQNDAKRILFGGSTLRGNEPLRKLLAIFGPLYGREVVFLVDGEFAGALGALELAESSAGVG
jgi:type II pantothenate kinase